MESGILFFSLILIGPGKYSLDGQYRPGRKYWRTNVSTRDRGQRWENHLKGHYCQDWYFRVMVSLLWSITYAVSCWHFDFAQP